jgi:hypothetical protein
MSKLTLSLPDQRRVYLKAVCMFQGRGGSVNEEVPVHCITKDNKSVSQDGPGANEGNVGML